MLAFHALLALALVASPVIGRTTPAKASTFVGSATSFQFPPPGATVTENASDFPDATQINVFGATPTGDEALAQQTAASFPIYANTFPLVEPGTQDHAPETGSSAFSVIHSWGNLSPFRSPDSSSAFTKSAFGLPGSTPLVPEGCELTQVHLLHRHGARYPTEGSLLTTFAQQINVVAAKGELSASGPLAFLNTWDYRLGAEILTPFGRAQLYELGVGFRVKYGELLHGFTDLPVWRTTSEERMVDSALQFAAGFFGVQSYQNDYHQSIIIEAPGFNNTLAPYDTCNNSNNAIADIATNFTNTWEGIYLADAVKRLQPFISGFTLNTTWAYAMQQTCAYETVALGYSAFCDLFTEEEWEGYEYSIDLSFWYDNGPGNPAVAAQGVGWVQELVSRLTGERLTQANTTTNGTLNSNPVTFPLDQPIFVDATHDTVISTIVVAMNFTSMAATGPLPATHIPKDRSYVVNQISPFSANLVGQVLSCPAKTASSPAQGISTSSPTHIRWLLNDAVVPLTGIKDCPESDEGLCPFGTFVKGMQQRLEEIDFFEGCFGNYSVPVPDLLVGGMIGGPSAKKVAE
ncbi:Acid phosphatase [Mycena chlorophos]|uniref:Acid phosphatase n=1 Tax=Mycena chlorophos TaxID=658473 RepID=A0A8H6RVY4_MYCCL|nr:Acid phosphatase [Mycena chlorophos]